MTCFSAEWQSLEQDPEDIYGRSLEDIVLTADVDSQLTVKYSIEFRRDQTYYSYDNESAITLYNLFVYDRPDYQKAAKQLFDELINDMAAEAAEKEVVKHNVATNPTTRRRLERLRHLITADPLLHRVDNDQLTVDACICGETFTSYRELITHIYTEEVEQYLDLDA